MKKGEKNIEKWEIVLLFKRQSAIMKKTPQQPFAPILHSTKKDNTMNISEEFSRTARVLGCDAIQKLAGAHVAVFGIGGVGGYVCEALARAGVGAIDLFDSDTVSLSNINRQIIALHSTVGKPKVEVMRAHYQQ